MVVVVPLSCNDARPKLVDRPVFGVEISARYEFGSQYNYTLLTNCLLGLVVLPKERAFDYLPTDKITKELRGEMGLNETEINTDISDLRRLIWSMRQSIAHFDIKFVSNNDEFLIDRIVFEDSEKGDGYVVASFNPKELLSFIRYYGGWFISNVQKYRKEIYEAAL